jgi:hypothetical protein
MADQTRDKELDALKDDIARLREEISGLVPGAKRAREAGSHPGGGHAEAEEKGPVEGEHGHDPFADLLHTFEASRAQGEKVVKNLLTEVEQHPLIGVIAAFGLGYLVAKLWHEGDKQ